MENFFGYNTLEKIGEGGFSKVYKIQDKQNPDRYYAAKKFEDLTDYQVFEREVQGLNAIKGIEGVQQFHSAIQTPKQLVVITEYVEGKTLKSQIGRNGPLSDFDTLNTLLQITKILICLQNKGLRHLDIKPSNIIVGDKLVLMDFGVADSAANSRNEDVKTDFNYAAPEKYYGFHTQNTDVYSLGITAYFMVTGILPFNPKGCPDSYKMLCHCTKPIKLPKEISTDLGELITNMTIKDPSDRLSLNDLKKNLEELINQSPSQIANIKQPRPQKSLKSEIDCYKDAAAQNIPYAQYKYALLMEDEDDQQGAQYWYSKASKHGFAKAKNNLALLLQKKGDIELSEKLFLEAAEDGNANAQYNLYKRYKNNGLDKAQHWLYQAARNFHKHSMNLVAIEFEKQGDMSRAYNLYLRAAYGSFDAAQYNLGLLHQSWFEKGSEQEKSTKDFNYAKHWFEQAFKQGHPKAKIRLEELEVMSQSTTVSNNL